MSKPKPGTNRVEPSLFGALEKIAPDVDFLLQINQKTVRENSAIARDYFAKLRLVKDGLILFMRSFYRQFFMYGYGISFDTLSGASIKKINEFPYSSKIPRPKLMIISASDFAANVSTDLGIIGYGGGDRFALSSAYCSSLANLLRAFIHDGITVVSNYQEICQLAEEFLTRISTTCRKST